MPDASASPASPAAVLPAAVLPAAVLPGPDGSLPDNAVAVRGLTKVYAGSKAAAPKQALSAVDLEIPRGALFGLLGPNGAGKSTLINILAGLVVKTGGSARVWGYDIEADMRAARRSIGVVPQELNIDPFFTPRELLDVQAGLYGVPRAARQTDRLLAIVGLTEKAGAYTRTLSGGMRRRLMVAKAMVHAPPVLVLDEPTAGVDVELRRQLWEQVRRLNQAGTTVLLTTHYLEEAEALCDRIAIINHGRVIACDTTAALLTRLDQKELTLVTGHELTAVPAALAPFDAQITGPRRLRIRYRRNQVRVADILAAVQATDLTIQDLSTAEADLEDIFIALTSGAAVGPGAGA